jgi:hypothetical protein
LRATTVTDSGDVQLCNYVDDSQHWTFRALGANEEEEQERRRGDTTLLAGADR